MVPFLKWPGGKRWFIHQHVHLLPARFDRYIEPFLGGGSVYFHLEPKSAIISDSNKELMTTYRALRDDWSRVLRTLRDHQRQHDEAYYYQIRESRPTSVAGQAARMIYLNRTCFNGIYRVSHAGRFNVPKGTKTSVLLPTDDFKSVSALLAMADLRDDDFETVIDAAGEGDFVFADPPYTVNHNNNGFIKYNEKLFSWQDQKRLADALERAAGRGAVVLATNADHHSVKRLYWGRGVFSLRTASRFSTMSCTVESRKQFNEIIIQANSGGKPT